MMACVITVQVVIHIVWSFTMQGRLTDWHKSMVDMVIVLCYAKEDSTRCIRNTTTFIETTITCTYCLKFNFKIPYFSLLSAFYDSEWKNLETRNHIFFLAMHTLEWSIWLHFEYRLSQWEI